MEEREKSFQSARVLLFGAGHMVADCYANFLPALIPIFIDKFGFSLAMGGALVSVMVFSGSLLQPLYGYLADRLKRNWFVILGPIVAAIFMSAVGLTSSLAIIFLLVFASGIGVACFHPQAAAMSGRAGRARHGLGISLFTAGGNIGFGAGPYFIYLVIRVFGLSKSYIACFPGILMSLILLFAVKKQPIQVGAGVSQNLLRPILARAKYLLPLFIIVVLRAAVAVSFVSFLPKFLSDRGMTLMMGTIAVLVFTLVGGFGGILGGHLSDLIGRKVVILTSLLLSVPFLALALGVSGNIIFLFLAIAGFLFYSGNPVNVTFAQEMVPESASLVSSIVMGFGWGIGGFSAWIVGKLGDLYGLGFALNIVIFLLLVASVFALALPGKLSPSKSK